MADEQGQGGGGKILGMPRAVALGGLAVVVAIIAVMWWRSRQANAANATGAGAAATATGGIDWSGPVSTLQTEVIDLQSSVSALEQAQDEQERDLRGFAREERGEAGGGGAGGDGDHDADDRRRRPARTPTGSGGPLQGGKTPPPTRLPARHHHHHRRKVEPAKAG